MINSQDKILQKNRAYDLFSYNVYVGKLYQKEIDFVAQRSNEKFYIQISDNISGQETFTLRFPVTPELYNIFSLTFLYNIRFLHFS